MSLDLEGRLKSFLAAAPQALRAIQTLEFSHSAMSQSFYLWRETTTGTITTEDGVRTVQPLNFEIKLAGTSANLDQNFEIRIDLTDVQDVFREELDRIPLTATERVRCVYREYLSDDLTDALATAVLQVETISYEIGAATLTAVSPRLNTTRTGEVYAPREIPMLRGFL